MIASVLELDKSDINSSIVITVNIPLKLSATDSVAFKFFDGIVSNGVITFKILDDFFYFEVITTASFADYGSLIK